MKPFKPDQKITDLAVRVIDAFHGRQPDLGSDTAGRKLYDLAVGYLIPQIPAVQVTIPPVELP